MGISFAQSGFHTRLGAIDSGSVGEDLHQPARAVGASTISAEIGG